MISINELVRREIALREDKNIQMTLLGICPTSEAVVAASVKVASRSNAPMLFPATLNQVDRDGGYTGWNQSEFVRKLDFYRRKYHCKSPLYPCLDHGGPWLKDIHTRDHLSIDETMAEVKKSLIACLNAGYSLLHIDPTVDRTLPAGVPMPIELVLERTVELIAYTEAERLRLRIPPISYEVGTEEVHGGLASMDTFKKFVRDLRSELELRGLIAAWPCFIVGRVGTDMHTIYFDSESARRLYQVVVPYGSLIKGHYTDWVSNLDEYPTSGMGAANIGADLTQQEYLALGDCEKFETDLRRGKPTRSASRIRAALETAVFESNRWQKWLLPDEENVPFQKLDANRKAWLIHSGARYIWTDARVIEARETLYDNLSTVMEDPHEYIVDRIARRIDDYIIAYRLFDVLSLLINN
jgi:D-tagatose-1,6-bisphosphate aldolase subunit GatZ/KbaZ